MSAPTSPRPTPESRPIKLTPWQRADAAFVPLPTSPTGLSPQIQTILCRGWMEALARRVERRRREDRLGLPSPRQWPEKHLLRKVKERRFFENLLRFYARADLWAALREEISLPLDLLDFAVGHPSRIEWTPLLLECCRRISVLCTALRQRGYGDTIEEGLKRLLAELEPPPPDLFPGLQEKMARRERYAQGPLEG